MEFLRSPLEPHVPHITPPLEMAHATYVLTFEHSRLLLDPSRAKLAIRT